VILENLRLLLFLVERLNDLYTLKHLLSMSKALTIESLVFEIATFQMIINHNDY
jgi:hypothetical protein